MKRLLNAFLVGFLTLVLCFSYALPVEATTQQELNEITGQWETSAHALNDVNCASCHQDSETNAFVAEPDHESCQSCHEDSVNTFLLGKHGIRLLEGETPLTPAMARLPMKHDAFQKQMTCNACHNVHSIDTVQASVDACLTCHNDTHSLNYKNSKHAELFAAEGELPRPGATAVTCATCHLPRISTSSSEETAVVKVNHNNTYTLKPQDRMVGDVCMNCHGVEYAYNSIFDAELVEANFDRPPTLELETFDLMRAFEERRSGNSSESEAE
ncbi:MAG: cytochrome c3 family protein [Cyanobacteria bacterium P01_D01_bin.44]